MPGKEEIYMYCNVDVNKYYDFLVALPGLSLIDINDIQFYEEFLEPIYHDDPAHSLDQVIINALSFYCDHLFGEAIKHGYEPVKEDK